MVSKKLILFVQSMRWINAIKRLFQRDVLTHESVGTVSLHFNTAHDATVRDYYLYVVDLIRQVAARAESADEIVFGSYPFTARKGRRVFRIDFQIEHTLVKPGGRGTDNAIEGVVPIFANSEKHYLVRVQDEERLSCANVIVEYSRSNLLNVKLSPAHSILAGKMAYIAPLIYDFDPIPGTDGRDYELITLFGNPNESRRKAFLESLVECNPQAFNVNGHFDGIRSVYRRTKILLNIRQTDHHDTLEELRVLPALLSGVVVISEDVPLRDEIPYKDFILWAPLSELPILAQRVRADYINIRESIFGGNSLSLCLKNMQQENERSARYIMSLLN